MHTHLLDIFYENHPRFKSGDLVCDNGHIHIPQGLVANPFMTVCCYIFDNTFDSTISLINSIRSIWQLLEKGVVSCGLSISSVNSNLDKQNGFDF